MSVSTLVDCTQIFITSTGTSALSLGAHAIGFQGVEALIDGQQYSYRILTGEDTFECGAGIYLASTNTLTRAPTSSSAGGDLIDVPLGSQVAITVLASDLDQILINGAAAADAARISTDAARQALEASQSAGESARTAGLDASRAQEAAQSAGTDAYNAEQSRVSAATSAENALTSEISARNSSQAAEALVGPVYATISDGLAGTTPGQAFAVADTDGIVKIYLHMPDGSALFQRTVLTAEYLQNGDGSVVGLDDGDGGAKFTTLAGFIARLLSSAGSALVGFIQSGADAVQRTLQSKARDIVSVKDFGAVGDGVTDDAASIQKAINSVFDAGGGEVIFPAGEYRINTPIIWKTGVKLTGVGNPANRQKPGTLIISNSSDLIHYGDSSQNAYGGVISGMTLTSEVGGGHIFNTVGTGQSRAEHCDIVLIQRNPDKSILRARYTNSGDGGYFGCWWHHFEAVYSTTNTVPAFDLFVDVGTSTLNQILFENARVGRGSIVSGGDYAFSVETARSNPVINVEFKQITFQQPGGGAIRIMGAYSTAIRNCGVYDLTTGSSKPLIRIGASASGLASKCTNIDGFFTNTGLGAASIEVDTVTAGSSCAINNSYFNTLDGLDPGSSGTGLILFNNDIGTIVNCNAYWQRANGLEVTSTSSTLSSYRVIRGIPGNFNGYVRILLNGSYVGGYQSGGRFIWGGTTATSPGFWVTSDGIVNASTEYRINNQKVVGARGAALPADATDLASAIALANAIKARMRVTGGHGLVAD